MPKLLAPSLKIVAFRNPSGSRSYRLTGTIPGGGRVRQNFPARHEAEAELARRLQTAPAGAPLTPVLTRLPEAEVREIELEISRLPPGTSVREAFDLFREHFQPLAPLPWTEAIEQFRAHLVVERKTLEATADDRSGELRQFARFSGERQIERTDLLRADLAKAWIYATGLEARSQRDRYDRLNQFCAWLVREKHATINPVAELVRPKVRVDPPEIFTPTQAASLLDAAWTDPEGPEMLPHFAICALSGVRPGECVQLQDADLFLEGDHPVIEVNKAKGGRSRRNVEIEAALLRILQRCRALGLAPGFFSKRKFDRCRRAAGLFELWEKDVERHSYASYQYELHRDVDRLVKNMGNSAKVLFTSYIRAVPHMDAIAYSRLAVNWKARRRKTFEGRRVDLWARQRPELLTAGQLAAVHRWRRRHPGAEGDESDRGLRLSPEANQAMPPSDKDVG